MISNQAFCFVSVYLYNTYSGSDEKNVIMQHLWLIVSSLLSFSMLSFATFMVLIKKEYRHTFYSTISGKQFLCDTWRNAKTDREKFNVFKKHKSYYKSINKDLKLWLEQNRDSWNYDGEEWFTAKMIAKIPSNLLPAKALNAMGGLEGRRKSIMKMKEDEKKSANERSRRRGSNLKIIPTATNE